MNIATRLLKLNTVTLECSSVPPLQAASAAPRGSKYLGPNGIPWSKTGGTTTSWTSDLRRAPYFNVKTYGALGNGVHDDSAAIQLAINAALAVRGVVFFPPGTYACSIFGVTNRFLLSGVAQSNIMFLGCGRSSKIWMTGNGGLADKALFHMRDGSKYITFKNLEFKSAINAGTESEQQHLIMFENRTASSDLETGRSELIDCYFGRTRGDALRFLGNAAYRVAKINCKRLVFDMESPVGQRSRSAFQFQRAADDISAKYCYCDNNASAIDFEPTGRGSNGRMRITGNHFVGQVSLSGNGAGEEHSKSVYSNNTLIGALDALDIELMVISGNIVDNQAATTEGCLTLFERINRSVISGNILYRANATTAMSPLTLDYHATGANYGLLIDGNLVSNESNNNDGGCVSLKDVSRSTVSNNMGHLAVNTTLKGSMYLSEGTTELIADIHFSGNMGVGTNLTVKQGFVWGGGNHIASDNLITGVNNGINMASGLRTESYMATRNLMSVAGNAIAAIESYILIEGSGTYGPSTYQITVAPNGVVPGVVGSVCLRSSGGGAGTSRYVKESGGFTTSGWVGK